MRGASRASLAETKERLTTAFSGATARDAATVGDELFEVVHMFDREHGVRRGSSDPSRSGDEKAALVTALLGGRLTPGAVELVAHAVRCRWSRSTDLADALEQTAVLAHVIATESAGKLDDLEDELFRFERLVQAHPDLRIALASTTLPGARKAELLAALLAGRVTEATLRLVTEAVTHPRGRSLEKSLADHQRLVAAWRQRLVAVVRTSVDLTAGQRSRLTTALSAAYGHEVHLNVLLDAEVIGGMSVRIGDELVDGTVASRLGILRRRLAS